MVSLCPIYVLVLYAPPASLVGAFDSKKLKYMCAKSCELLLIFPTPVHKQSLERNHRCASLAIVSANFALPKLPKSCPV